MPLVNIIGVTPNNKNFFIGSAFIPSETVEDYKFIFGALAHLYESIEREYPNIGMEAPATILGDGDAQQIAAIETVFLDTQYRLCIWHINGNIQAKLLPKIKAEFDSKSSNSSAEERKEYIDETWKNFKNEWMGTLQANSPAIWDSNWMQFRGDYDNRFPSVMAYIQKSIVDKHTKRLVKCWTDRHYNWGIQATSRGEGQHGILKNELGSLGTSRGDIKDVVDKFRLLLRRTNSEIRASLSQESQKFVQRFEPSIFSKVIKKVSIYALDRVLGQYFLLKPPKGEEIGTLRPCSHLFRTAWGLPCVHEIKERIDTNKSLEPEDFHPHWFLDRRLDGHHSVPPCRQFENIQEPRIAVPKGRQPGALGKRKKQKEDLSTERNSSHHEVVAAAVSGDNSQLKGIHRAPKPRGRKRKATEDISSSQAPELRRGLRRKQGTSG